MNSRRFFSLLELIITLGILAVVSTMLLDNFADVKARQCSNVTRERGEQVRSVIMGEDGHKGIGGFLSDMGRLPNIYIPKVTDGGDGDGGRRLAELYDISIWDVKGTETALSHVECIESDVLQGIVCKQAGSTFPPDATVFYPEIRMSVGWGGPYLAHRNPVKGKFFDGWGRGWRMISNYNMRVDSGHLVENWHDTIDENVVKDKIKIYGTSTKIESLRGERGIRIDGIVSFGGNDVNDRVNTNVDAADEDQGFLFPYHSNTTGHGIAASLEIELKILDNSSGNWLKMPEIRIWQSNVDYAVGAIVARNDKLYRCMEANLNTDPSSGSVDNRWVALTGATEVYVEPQPQTPGPPDPPGSPVVVASCRYQNKYWVRTTAGVWSPLGLCETYPDSLSLLLAVPVKVKIAGSEDAFAFKLGAYHFFRNCKNPGVKFKNPRNENYVLPKFYSLTTDGTSYSLQETADMDAICSDEAHVLPDVSDIGTYNECYLAAEDFCKDDVSDSYRPWNEYLIRRLIPGQRRLFCITYNSDSKTSLCSDVETIELRPGSNRVTLYLRSR